MASIVITIETDGAAFQGSKDKAVLPKGREVARILRYLADEFMCYGLCSVPVHDRNDNACGKVEVLP